VPDVLEDVLGPADIISSGASEPKSMDMVSIASIPCVGLMPMVFWIGSVRVVKKLDQLERGMASKRGLSLVNVGVGVESGSSGRDSFGGSGEVSSASGTM
jgi:hypothetical protein